MENNLILKEISNSCEKVALDAHYNVDIKNLEQQQHSKKKLDNLMLNTHKAGMEGLDAEKINKIIQEASKGSKFYQHKQKAQEKLDARIAEMKATANKLSAEQLDQAHRQMARAAAEGAAQRDLSRTIVHVDMDMFYAAVEMRDNPELRSIPMAVGGKDMLSTSNYAARKFGVRAAMPGFIALKLCPSLVIVPPNFSKYKSVSKVVESVFALYDPNYVMMSLDEAYLDITEYLEANGATYASSDTESLAEVVVREMRQKIQDASLLTASAGIAPNTRLAKVCSDLKKPNGQFYLPHDPSIIMDFVNNLSIRKISGIGNVMEQHLKALGITKCGDIAPKLGLLKLLFSDTNHEYFLRISLGLGQTDLMSMSGGERKSISTETTFTGTSDRQQLFKVIHDLCVDLERDMKKRNIAGKLLTLKTKSTHFVLKTRSMGLSEATNDVIVMENLAKKILIQEINRGVGKEEQSLRLLGVRMSSLCDCSSNSTVKQLTLNNLFVKTAKRSENNEPNSDISNSESTLSLPNADATKQSFTCPICFKDIETRFLTVFNKHIDSCLNNVSEKYSDDIDNNVDSDKKPLESCSTSEHRSGVSKQSNSKIFFLNKVHMKGSISECCADVTSSTEHVTTVQTHSGTASFSQSPLTCPVCLAATFSCSVKLNKHLDACLQLCHTSSKNSSKVSFPSSQKRKNIQSNSKSSKRSKPIQKQTIMNYFT